MGELARMPGCPEMAKTPMELLTPLPGQGFSFLDIVGGPIIGAVTPVACFYHYNLMRKRPGWSGIHMHIILAAVGCYLTTKLTKWKHQNASEADAILKYYVSLHPEDFPSYGKKRVGDLYVPFKPIR